ncbi:Gelation factor [Acropora cervicornis]|uniref:Gelation factor n=1 Tax=Acropora cervicornis TaxID=6130 RepID=A0AAD9VB14_ACRCE|nr:Gelation factor [Acropora cervicornis]
MRIQIRPRYSPSSRDFYKISGAFFVAIYVFLWISKPEYDKGLTWSRYAKANRLENMLLVNITSRFIWNKTEGELERDEMKSNRNSEFVSNWCRERQARLDWKAMLASCAEDTAWSLPRNRENATDPNMSFISLWDVQPVGEYSRFSIQSQTKAGKLKTQGGDSWRVRIRGPSSISAVVIDHGNGTYEVLFLVMEAGVYTLHITLDFTLCDGFRDPPSDWFIVGNAQGKFQRHREVDGNKDYLQAPLWGGSPVQISIPPAKDGSVSLSSIPDERLKLIARTDCGITCKFIWDGRGRWVQNTWKPHVKEPLCRSQNRSKDGTLWIYGDSVNVFFAQSLRQRKLCREIFSDCNFSYNWIYPVKNVTVARKENDNLDYNNERVLLNFRRELQRPGMKNNSAIIFNFGLHFVESINFTSYKKLIDGVGNELDRKYPEIFLWNSTRLRRNRGKAIWKTTTAINKERASNIHLGNKRFLTQQRILLYNAFATTRMCEAGFHVLDVYPISDSYPPGTGTHGAHGLVGNDIVHYSNLAFNPVEELFEKFFGGI